MRRADANVGILAFLLNYPWEFLQMPFYAGGAAAPFWPATVMCSLAAVGDGAIMAIAYRVAALFARDRDWVLAPRLKPLAVFLLVGIIATLIIEFIALRASWGWSYSAALPRLPILGAGLAPLLQWLVLPPLVLWFVRRQVRGAAAIEAESRNPPPDRANPEPNHNP